MAPRRIVVQVAAPHLNILNNPDGATALVITTILIKTIVLRGDITRNIIVGGKSAKPTIDF